MNLFGADTYVLLFSLLEVLLGDLYVSVPASEDLLYNGYTNQTFTFNVEECAALCFQVKKCNSFTFVSQNCYLYETPAPFLLQSTSLSGAKTYRMSKVFRFQVCGSGFDVDPTGTLCYKVMDGTDNKLNFLDALTSCIDMNSDLVTLDSSEKLTRYQDLIQSQGSLQSSVWWVGGYDIGGQNTDWQWSNGRPVDSTFWRSGEPNSVAEKCSEAHGTQLILNDISCNKKLNFICEKIIV